MYIEKVKIQNYLLQIIIRCDIYFNQKLNSHFFYSFNFFFREENKNKVNKYLGLIYGFELNFLYGS